MKPLDVFVAFGNKLKRLKNTHGNWEAFDPEQDREFQLLLAMSQECYQMFEDQGLVMPLTHPDSDNDDKISKELLYAEIRAVVEKYQ